MQALWNIPKISIEIYTILHISISLKIHILSFSVSLSVSVRSWLEV